MRWLLVSTLSGCLLLAGEWSGTAAGAQVPAADAAKDQPPTDWQAELKRRHQELIARNGPGTDEALQAQLLKMLAADQEARGLKDGPPKPGERLQIATNMAEIDAALTDQLKQIVKAHGWPAISLVGIDASNGAMTILTHTRDHEWQRSLLPQLEQLADGGKIDGSSLALVIDKQLVAEGRLQRYGTQFKAVDGGMAMYAVEDPGGLDARRARVFLGPMDAYKQQLSEMYHLKATNQILMATPPAKQP